MPSYLHEEKLVLVNFHTLIQESTKCKQKDNQTFQINWQSWGMTVFTSFRYRFHNGLLKFDRRGCHKAALENLCRWWYMTGARKLRQRGCFIIPTNHCRSCFASSMSRRETRSHCCHLQAWGCACCHLKEMESRERQSTSNANMRIIVQNQTSNKLLKAESKQQSEFLFLMKQINFGIFLLKMEFNHPKSKQSSKANCFSIMRAWKK